MSKKVVVIGGGIIGLCSAYYLHKENHEVTIIDRSPMNFGASYINAGYLSPSHIIPLAAPGVFKKGMKWMLNPQSPLYIKPRFEKDFLYWLWFFMKSCSHKNVNQSITAIRDIALLGRDLYSEIKEEEHFSFHLDKKGLLIVCQTEKLLQQEVFTSKRAIEHGLQSRTLSANELCSLEPNVCSDIQGGVHYECDWHTTPHTFMTEIKAYLKSVGVEMLKNEEVTDIVSKNRQITLLKTENKTYTADEFVLAAGSWSNRLSKKIGIKLPLEAGKGYRIDTHRDLGISFPAILAEAKVAVTPMQNFTRFSGTMEIAGINHNINQTRVNTIAAAVERFYKDIWVLEEEKYNSTCGLRPVSPDGVPYIGKSNACQNLTIATGHAMMGWTMGTATGKLVSEIISDRKPSLDLSRYHPDRKF